MIEFGIIATALIGGGLGWVIIQSFIGHRYWRKAIAEGDDDAMHAALLEALDTWRRMRPPANVIPSDWRALQSVGVVAADGERCRVSLLADPDIRVVDGVRDEVGAASNVARRAAVRMAERLLYEIPLIRFDAVQVDVYTEYRHPDGAAESECLLTTQLTRAGGAGTDWDELSAEQILETWTTRERRPGETLDPDSEALISVEEGEPAARRSRNGTGPASIASAEGAEREP